MKRTSEILERAVQVNDGLWQTSADGVKYLKLGDLTE